MYNLRAEILEPYCILYDGLVMLQSHVEQFLLKHEERFSRSLRDFVLEPRPKVCSVSDIVQHNLTSEYVAALTPYKLLRFLSSRSTESVSKYLRDIRPHSRVALA